MTEDIKVDVAIVGGGPAGSTAATLLKKYAPELSVLIIERETFPRDHIGESQLPSISPILHEMGVWDKIEAADFPIKIGASYTWGANSDQWDFDFYPVEKWQDEPRPTKFEGQRTFTAFQVDRAIYDTILLDHAKSLGADILQPAKVSKVHTSNKNIDHLELADGRSVSASYYIDCTGVVGLLRRALGVETKVQDELRNIAVWSYWQNAEWAVKIGVGGTRVQVRSLPFGWIWFIPLGPTRTSVGLICPSSYYKESGKSVAELYDRALSEQPEIAALLKNAEMEADVQTCKDWSHLADQLVGDNWFLCGESAGFADPILAAGMSLAHSSAREAAYTIIELTRGELDPAWLRTRYNTRNRTNIDQHIRFAKYWYAANGCFTDLQAHCQSIAKTAGLSLSPDAAWQWLSQGGFTTERIGKANLGSFDLASAKHITEFFNPDGEQVSFLASGKNVFRLNLKGAKRAHLGQLENGRIKQVECYQRGGVTLPLAGYYIALLQLLEQTEDAATIVETLQRNIVSKLPESHRDYTFGAYIQALETMIDDGWVKAFVNPARPSLDISTANSRRIRTSEEAKKAISSSKT